MFDTRTELANKHAHIFDPSRPINDSYDSWDAMNYSARAQKTPQNYQNYRKWNSEGVQFRPENIEDESGVCSPPLWKTSPPRSPERHRQDPDSHRYLSPTSKSQAIARGQWELMEMVKKMPESTYELSLKDLVEHQQQPRSVIAQDDSLLKETDLGEEVVHQRVKVKRQESKGNEKKGKIIRSERFDHRGLFLKMVFPISLGLKKKKKKNSGTITCAKVSPRPENFDKSSKGGEKDWWKKRFLGSSEGESGVGNNGSSDSIGSRSSSRSNSTRKRIVFLPACWPRIFSTNRKSAK